MKEIDYVIIIPTFNRLKLLNKLLSDLLNQDYKNFAIVIADSSDNSLTVKEGIKSKKIFYKTVSSNKWWTGAVNAGILFSRNLFSIKKGIVLLNDDTRVEKTFISNINFLQSDNKNTLIGCVNVDLNDKSTILYAGKSSNNWTGFGNKFDFKKNINEINRLKLNHSFDLIGRGLFIPIAVFDKIGYFDEKHFKHRGDTEFPLRAKKAGYRLIVSYLPVVYIDTSSTYLHDIKEKYSLKDFKMVFLDFRSSSYIKTRFYYSRSATNNLFQFIIFFSLTMAAHFRRFILKLLF